jgi:hypothetical protein
MTNQSSSDDRLPTHSGHRIHETVLSREQAVESINKILERMIGERCWSCVAMEFTGTVVSLDFGDPIPWSSKRQGEPPELRGVFGAFIEGAAWRLLLGDVPVMTSATAMTEQRAAEMSVIINSPIKWCSIVPETFDLSITFASGVRLDVFCNCFDESLDNYTLNYMDEYYAVKFKDGQLVVILERPAQPMPHN